MAKASEFRLLLIRSGDTAWDREGRLAGQSDLPLAEGVAASIERAAHEHVGTGVGLILAAPDEASGQTAEILSRATGARVRRIGGLREPGLGLWEGLRATELEDRCPSTFHKWREDPSGVHPPQGESLAEAGHRIRGEVARALTRSRGHEPAIGLVVRPMARGIIRCWLEQRGLRRLWEASAAGRDAEWHLLDRELLDAVLAAPATSGA